MLEFTSKGVLIDVLSDKGEAFRMLVRKPSTRRNDLPTGGVASLLKDEPTRVFAPSCCVPWLCNVFTVMPLVIWACLGLYVCWGDSIGGLAWINVCDGGFVDVLSVKRGKLPGSLFGGL